MESGRGETPFSDAAWTFALPTPGYRMLAEFGDASEGCRLRSRRGVDTTRRFAEVARALAALCVPGRTVVDGEICVFDASGRPDLRRLHERALHPGQRLDSSSVTLCMRDVLVWAGRDVRTLPWLERQRLLRRLPLQRRQGTLRLQRTVYAEGSWLWRQAQALGCESVHAYRHDVRYVAGPSSGWLSIPCTAAAGASGCVSRVSPCEAGCGTVKLQPSLEVAGLPRHGAGAVMGTPVRTRATADAAVSVA